MSDIIQGTEEWREIRCGKITASRIADIMARTKSGPSASRKNYVAELAIERLTGVPTESFTSREMQWGTDNEPAARTLYELTQGVTVAEIGFVSHPSMPFAGCSPDGLVDPGGVEIKCPNSATHIETLRTRKVPSRYMYQIQWTLDCTKQDWWDFVSYDPRMRKPGLQLFVTRVEPAWDMIVEIRAEVEKVNAEVDALVAELEALA
jgi:putative phage-type endonuclease